MYDFNPSLTPVGFGVTVWVNPGLKSSVMGYFILGWIYSFI